MASLPWTAPPALSETVELRVTRLPLCPKRPAETQVGDLTYRGGLRLTAAATRPPFGEISGLRVSPDGKRLLAVQDFGWWLRAELVYDERGDLSDLRNAEVAPMFGPDGAPLEGKESDAEGLTVAPGATFGGDVLVSFEHDHRVWRYPLGKDGLSALPSAVAMPEALGQAPPNQGLEAITVLDDGRLLALTELDLDDHGDTLGWIVDGARSHPVRLARNSLHAVTDLATLPGGDVLVLERIFLGSPSSMRIRRIPVDSLRPGARLDGKVVAELGRDYSIDNMEGMAVRVGPGGEVLLYLVSDDSRDPRQRTVLLMFSLGHS